MKVEIKGDTLIVTVKIDKALKVSASGKSLVLATSGGNKDTGVEYEGKPVTLGFNAYIKNPNYKP